jgi:BirA family transcriptional regulator, biotin operon repressor / biotin---[acetyl-CoA-carboxylase] ligase
LTSFRSEPIPQELASALLDAGPRLGRFLEAVEYFSTTGSTNDVALHRAASGDHEYRVVVADAQTAGRGRRGRTWFSPPGTGLYVSAILAPARAHDANRARTLTTLAAGVAVAEGIGEASGLRTDLKWPNDVFVGRRKLAGILAEGAADAVVLGYGINVGTASFPLELADRVTSLESELGRPVDRTRVLVETLAALAARYDDLLAGRFDAILDAWRARAPGCRGARVSWTTPAGVQTGVTAGIDDQGALLVRVGERVDRVVAGELRWTD